jgi:CRP-like cAMP-binding protein
VNIEAALKEVEIFARLNDRQLARLARLATRREFAAGTQILHRGDTGVALYIILRGRVAVTLQPEEGQPEHSLGEMGPGASFGEMALIDGGPRSADVKALEPTECLLLTRWDFQGELRQDADIARALLPSLCARVRRLTERLGEYEPKARSD